MKADIFYSIEPHSVKDKDGGWISAHCLIRTTVINGQFTDRTLVAKFENTDEMLNFDEFLKAAGPKVMMPRNFTATQLHDALKELNK
jgi:hypothetical protein